jgi:hypothetical protein
MAMEKVQSGDPLVIPAGTFNTFIDAARDFQQRQRSQQQRPHSSFTDRSTVLLRNDSGAGRSRFSVLEVDGVVIGPGDNLESFQNTPAVTGVTPTEDHAGRFAILLDPIEAGEIGRALLAGVCPCQVDVTDEEHQFAAPTDGDASKLTSAESGPAHILWADTGIGTKWCLVRLGGPAPTAGVGPVGGYWEITITGTGTMQLDAGEWKDVVVTHWGRATDEWGNMLDGVQIVDHGGAWPVDDMGTDRSLARTYYEHGADHWFQLEWDDAAHSTGRLYIDGSNYGLYMEVTDYTDISIVRYQATASQPQIGSIPP